MVDPYGDNKPVHLATAIRSDGAASALCFKREQAISPKMAKWTTARAFVTCAKCKRLLKVTYCRVA